MIGGALRKKPTKMIDTQTFPSKMIVTSAETRFTEHNKFHDMNLTTHFVLFTKRNSGRQEVQPDQKAQGRQPDPRVQVGEFPKTRMGFRDMTHYFQTHSTPGGAKPLFHTSIYSSVYFGSRLVFSHSDMLQ